MDEKEWAEKHELSLKRAQFVTKRNSLIQNSRYSLTTEQIKVLLYLISKIRPGDTGKELYAMTVSEYCRICGINDSGKNGEDIKAALKTIADKSIWVKMGRREVLLRWFNHVEYNRQRNCIEVSFHQDMLPYLYELYGQYTQYTLDNILAMGSHYTIRLFELLKSYENLRKPIQFTPSELRTRLDAEQYTHFYDLRRRVLDPAVKDINEISDLEVSYTTIQGKNRTTEYVIFDVVKPEDGEAYYRMMKRYSRFDKRAEENT